MINVDEARNQIFELLARVEKGEEIIIVNEGKAVVLLTTYPNSQQICVVIPFIRNLFP